MEESCAVMRSRSPALRTVPSSTSDDAEQGADGAHVLGLPLEREDGGARGDAQPLRPGRARRSARR